MLESAAGLSQSVPQALWSVRRANVRPLNTEPPYASGNAPQPRTDTQNPSLSVSRKGLIDQTARNNDQSVLPIQTIKSDTSALRADLGRADQSKTDQRTADQSQSDQISSAVAEDAPPVKKSSTGICHAQGSSYYAQTKKFEAFKTICACFPTGEGD